MAKVWNNLNPDEKIEHYIQTMSHREQCLFLNDLTAIAKCYGYCGDYEEIYRFVEWCYKQFGHKAPDLEPYSWDQHEKE